MFLRYSFAPWCKKRLEIALLAVKPRRYWRRRLLRNKRGTSSSKARWLWLSKKLSSGTLFWRKIWQIFCRAIRTNRQRIWLSMTGLNCKSINSHLDYTPRILKLACKLTKSAAVAALTVPLARRMRRMKSNFSQISYWEEYSQCLQAMLLKNKKDLLWSRLWVTSKSREIIQMSS